MSSPAELIRALDEALENAGATSITLARMIGGTEVTVTVRAAVRLVNKPDPSVSGTHQDERRFIMSMTEIRAASWPGTGVVGSGFKARDTAIPVRGDRVYHQGIFYRVEGVNPIEVQGTVVRVEVFAKGNASGT